MERPWTIAVPARTHWLLAQNKVPTGETEPIERLFPNPGTAALKDYNLDDVFSDLVRDEQGRAHARVTGKAQQLEFLIGPNFRGLTVWAPNPSGTGLGSNAFSPNPPAARPAAPPKPSADPDFICFEPLAAIVNGLNLAHKGLYKELQHIEPGGTWHRMLTDEVGHLLELSTRSYQPTGPIWRHVVAEHSTCFRPGCDAPSTGGDLDHRVAWPFGPTDTENLWPGCRTDHRTKHAPGFSVEQTENGRYVLRTAAGFRHPIPVASHPVSDDFSWPEVDADGFQFGATELRQALEVFQQWSELSRARKPEQYWEADFDDGLTEEEWRAIHIGAVA